MNASPERLIAIFDEAKAIPASPQREQFLAAACAEDAHLHQHITALLAAHESAGEFLKPLTLQSLETQATQNPGDQIGRYKLLEQIGEGGCGVVYMAEQEQPVRRRVALKIIKLGMDTRQVVARFEAERQALAMMEHSSIAKVFDAGATETGRPYFAMELVRGIKITDYCDQQNLPTEERLTLFAQICQAIQHAHQKGIIHRDIKPSNVLVTVNDGVAVPKVIDFGIAKATEQRLADNTVFTCFEQFIGTPAYMSPEQAEMTSVDIDTRSDVYSLGVLLYELLTGRTPFGAEELAAAGVQEIRRIIQESEPAKPSSHLAALGAAHLETVAASRQAAAPQLLRRVRGDLDWIVMKCLEKDRARRYETASALVADLQRHLDSEPVMARPPSRGYRFRKFVRRNRVAFAASAAVAVALVLGLCVASWALVRERTARREAEAARSMARSESARNEEVARFLMVAIGRDSAGGGGAPLMRPDLLNSFSAQLAAKLSDQPGAQGDLWLGVADSWVGLRDFDQAITNCRRAIDAYQLAYGAYHPRVALAVSRLASYQSAHNDFAAARATAEDAVTIARRCNDPETLAVCLLDAAKSISSPGKPVREAIPLLREAKQLRKHVVPHLLALLDSSRLLAQALETLAREGKREEARAIIEEELEKSPKDADLLRLLRLLDAELIELQGTGEVTHDFQKVLRESTGGRRISGCNYGLLLR